MLFCFGSTQAVSNKFTKKNFREKQLLFWLFELNDLFSCVVDKKSTAECISSASLSDVVHKVQSTHFTLDATRSHSRPHYECALTLPTPLNALTMRKFQLFQHLLCIFMATEIGVIAGELGTVLMSNFNRIT